MNYVPIFILLALQILSVGIHLAKHGEDRKGKYNVGYSLLAISITWGLLYWAGVFDQILSEP